MKINSTTNRERRLRRNAEKKGLAVCKRRFKINGVSYPGFLIMEERSRLVLTGYGYWNNLIPLEEAEDFVSEYEG